MTSFFDLRRPFLAGLFTLLLCMLAAGAYATSISLGGSWNYQYSQSNGSAVTLAVDRITSNATSGTSGTLRMELWAFATPFTGVSQSGYQLATHQLSTLTAGASLTSVNSGTLSANFPPAGTWNIALLITEYNGSSWVTVAYATTRTTNTLVCSGGSCSVVATAANATLSANKTSYTLDGTEELVLSGSVAAGTAAGSKVDIYIQAQVNGGSYYYLNAARTWVTAPAAMISGFTLADVSAPNFYRLRLSGLPVGTYTFRVLVVKAGTGIASPLAVGSVQTSFVAAPSPSPDDPATGGGATGGGSGLGVFVDDVVKGVTYFAEPSGIKGTTTAAGEYSFNPGDTVTFSLPTGGGGSITLGSRLHDANQNSATTYVTSLMHGEKIAAVLQALNHGSSANMDVSGLIVPDAVATEMRNYIATDGTNLAGLGSDDEFLRHLQTTITTPAPYLIAISGTTNTFLLNEVIPRLQNALGNSPANPLGGAQWRLTGSLVEFGTVQVDPIPGCTALTATGRGGEIVNMTVDGNIMNAGLYNATITTGSYYGSVTTSDFSCTVGTTKVTTPGKTTSQTLSGFTGNLQIRNNGNGALTVNGNLIQSVPAGCVMAPITGTVIGLSNPMVTLNSTLTCNISGAAQIVNKITVKLVGAF